MGRYGKVWEKFIVAFALPIAIVAVAFALLTVRHAAMDCRRRHAAATSPRPGRNNRRCSSGAPGRVNRAPSPKNASLALPRSKAGKRATGEKLRATG
jgi:hypothetical protein